MTAGWRSVFGILTDYPATKRSQAILDGRVRRFTVTTMSSNVQLPTADVIGTTTNNNAAAGEIGEYSTATQSFTSSPVSLTTATPADIISISLTAGDWDVWGATVFSLNSATTTTLLYNGISIISATMPLIDSGNANYTAQAFAASVLTNYTLMAPVCRISLAATTTVYLVARADFAVSTMTAGGTIKARRVR